MIFEQHYLDCLSQASYLIGDPASGRAVVVDPRRDVALYLASAEEHGLAIELIIETHFHADFLSGHLELAAATGATIAYGSKAETEFESRKLADGERIDLGAISLEIRHTPGHTPESISVVIHDGGPQPYGVLTGDTLFVGDVGRPDLLSSQGVSSAELGSMLYDSLHRQLMTLPDETRVFPAHGAGSACGKNLSSETSSTIGRQRVENYALAPMTEAEFIDVVTTGQSSAPAYFSFDAGLNRQLRSVLDEGASVPSIGIDQVIDHQRAGGIVLDARAPEVFAAGHLEGSINVGLGGRYAEQAGGILNPNASIVLVTEPGAEQEAKIRLARIGFDNVIGALADVSTVLGARPELRAVLPRLDALQLKTTLASSDIQLVDVRQPGETADGFIDGAVLVPLTELNRRIDVLDPARPTVIYCAGGYRSAIAASRLAAAGFGEISDLEGGYGAWVDAVG